MYDVGALLVSGDNAIAVALGNGFYANPTVNVGNISLICQLSVSFANGEHQWVAVSGLPSLLIALPPFFVTHIHRFHVEDHERASDV